MRLARGGVSILAAPLLAGCVLLGPVVGPAPSPVASDAPVPTSLRAAIEPARAALDRGWQGPAGVDFRFARAICAIGAEVALVFRQQTPGLPDAWALALARDIAKGINFGGWRVRYDVADPAAEPALIELIDGQEIACP